MLNIVRCGFSRDLRYELTERILKKIAHGERALLIVPEQQTVISEVEMAKRLPPSSVLSFEVTNFTRLSNTVFRSLGGLFGEYCDKTRESLIMWRTLTELSAVLEMTSGGGEIGVGLVGRALAAVKELESLGLSADALQDSMENEKIKSNARLYSKLSDLSKIYALYKTLLSEKYLDSHDMLDAATKRLAERPDYLKSASIFVEGFTSFTEGQYAMLSTLSARADVTVYFVLSGINEGGFEYSEIRPAEEALRRLARRAGSEIKLDNRLQKDRENNSAIINIAESLWQNDSDNVKYSLQNPDDLRIFEAYTPFDEADLVAADINRRVHLGARYSDFAIISRDTKSYDGIIDYSLKRQGIPSFTSRGRELASYEIIKLIYMAYGMLIYGFRREEVLSYAKCSLSGISREECDELEIYVDTWQITKGRFTDGKPWSMNPDGYTSRRETNTDEKLARINATRERLISPLLRFKAEAEAATTVRAQATALVNYLTDTSLYDILTERVKALAASGERELADEEDALWQLIIDTLDLIVEISGDTPTGVDGFLSQLKVAFSSREFGRIPAFRDAVTIGSADMLRLFDKKHIYLIGVLEGSFPATISQSSYFSDRDKEQLCLAGLDISPDTEARAGRELYIFTRAMSYGTESVTVSYPTHSTVFKLVPRAAVIDKLISLTEGLERTVASSISPLDITYSPEYALESELVRSAEVRRALSDAGFTRLVEITGREVKISELKIPEDVAKTIYGGTLRLSQSAIDRYVSCPLSHFLQYSLKLKEERRAEFDARNIGTFIHAILENYFATISERKIKPSELSPEELSALVEDCATKFVSEIGDDDINSPRTRVKIERLKSAALPIVDTLSEELNSSAFVPSFFELDIGRSKPNTPDAIVYKDEGGDIKIYGIVDRVDLCQIGDDVAVRVIDYKTGSKNFSPDNIKEGKNLQMFLYLKAICDSKNEDFRRLIGVKEGGKLIPAGVVYVKTSLNDLKADIPTKEEADAVIRTAIKREGMILNNSDLISAMGVEYTPLADGRNPGEISKSKQNLLYDEDGWEQITSDIECVVRDIVGRMRGGDISAIPKDDSKSQYSACEYCSYKAVCRNVRKK